MVINGGITEIDQAIGHLEKVDGVMVGREAYQNPWSRAKVDEMLFDSRPDRKSRFDVLDRYKQYMEAQLGKGVPLKRLARHLLGLFQGQPGARVWRRALSDEAFRARADLSAIESAEHQLDAVLEKHVASAEIPEPQMEQSA